MRNEMKSPAISRQAAVGGKKLVGLVSISAMILSMCVFLFALPESVSAVDPSYPDQGCVNGVQDSGVFTWADSSPTVVFTPRFNWLNAVSVRIKGTNPTGTPRVEAQIWNWHSSPHQMIATHSVDLTNRTSEYWEFITESSQDIDPGLPYALILVPKNGTLVYWSATTDTSCYTRGYAMHDGAQDNSLMYGFSTYGWYDYTNPNSDGTMPGTGTPSSGSTSGTSSSTGSTGAPAADPSSSNPNGVTGSTGSTGGTSSSGSGSTGSSPKSTTGSSASKSSWTPDIAGILADYGKDENSGGISGILANLFSSPILFLIWPIISFLFWLGVIILIIILVVRHNKKKKAAEAAAATLAAPAPKVEEKKEETKK